MPGCSGGQNSTVERESGLCVCGVQSDFLSPFPYSGDVKILEVGQRGIDNPLSSVITFC